MTWPATSCASGWRTSKARNFPLRTAGESRQVTVDLDPQKLLQRGIAGTEVVDAVNNQNLVVPAGHGEDRGPRI